MKIDFLCNDGSPIGVTSRTLWGDDRMVGIGGSEYAMITLCEEWTKAGHQVTLYNSPREFGVSPFEQRNVSDFHPNDPRDVLINFRSPNPATLAVNNCLKVWLSCDQFSVGNYAEFAGHVHKIVCISPRHAEYFQSEYRIQGAYVIDIPIRIQDYDDAGAIEKVPNRIIFTSVPARGLDNLHRIYLKLRKRIPDVSLVITSDYRLWGVDASNEQFRMNWLGIGGVQYLGAIPRRQLIEEVLKSEITLYPSNYDELFCVAIAESQVAGSYPVTSSTGALPTTNMGGFVGGSGDDTRNDHVYTNIVESLLNDRESLLINQNRVKQLARERFSPARILEEWNEKIFR